MSVKQSYFTYLPRYLKFFHYTLTNKQRHYDKPSNWEQFTANAPRLNI